MQQRTAIQSSMGIGERPAQGEMFAEFRDFDGHKEPLTKPPTKRDPCLYTRVCTRECDCSECSMR